MSKFLKKLAFVVLTLLTIAGAVLTATASAEGTNPQQVQSGSSVRTDVYLNVRETPCGKVNTVLKPGSVGQVLNNAQNGTQCSVNGITYNFYYVTMTQPDGSNTQGFVASQYLGAGPIVGDIFNVEQRIQVTSSTGLNVRNAQCNKTTVVSVNTKGTVKASPDMTGSSLICPSVGNYRFQFVHFDNGTKGYVATAYLKAI